VRPNTHGRLGGSEIPPALETKGSDPADEKHLLRWSHVIMKCFQAKAGQIEPQWYVIDARDAVVGRLAAQIAPILMGKHRPTYTPHIDTGDYVIVTNVDKVVFTGNKWRTKTYASYSGHPGGLKEEPAWKLFERFPERILEEAIRRMMPKSKMGRHMMSKLKLYSGDQHPHQAQQPIALEPLNGRVTAAGLIPARKPSPKAQKAVASAPVEPSSPAPASDES
jgi:large subunit ribosomal protein L13